MWKAIACGIVLGLALCALVDWDAKRWAAYKAAHHCVATGQTRDGGFTIVIIDGNPYTIINPDENAYACDTGTVWR